MADAHLTLQIVDEGYYRKFFALSPTTNLKKLLDAYRGHLCPLCSQPDLLDFWYDTTQVSSASTQWQNESTSENMPFTSPTTLPGCMHECTAH